MELIQLFPDSADISQVKRLNLEAFPDNERVDIDDLFEFGSDGKMDILGIYRDGEFCGFFVIRKSERIAYIAYFAVCAEKRSQGIGGAALRALAESYPGRQIVVDFEALDEVSGNNAQRQRRRDFYYRNGFFETGWFQFYMQTEFEIACISPVFDKDGFEQMIAEIHERAPEFDPHMYKKTPENEGGQ